MRTSTLKAEQAAIRELRAKGFEFRHNKIARQGWIVTEPNGKQHAVRSCCVIAFAQQF